jgi:hypothetical protein
MDVENREVVIVATGESNECLVASEETLHESLHRAMCYCKQPWDKCETDGVTEAIRIADDDDNWLIGEDGRFSLSFDFEDGKIFVYYVTERE